MPGKHVSNCCSRDLFSTTLLTKDFPNVVPFLRHTIIVNNITYAVRKRSSNFPAFGVTFNSKSMPRFLAFTAWDSWHVCCGKQRWRTTCESWAWECSYRCVKLHLLTQKLALCIQMCCLFFPVIHLSLNYTLLGTQGWHLQIPVLLYKFKTNTPLI